MPTGRYTHVLLDFFGTLVDYVPGGASAVPRSCGLVRSFGAPLTEQVFVERWEQAFLQLDEHSAADDREFSMADLARAFLGDVLGRVPAAEQVDALVDTYLDEWNTGVRYSPDTARAIDVLASRFRLAVVTNTHDDVLVPAHLAAMGIADRIDTVITSVEVGWRKPHPAIYAEALRRLGIGAADAVFVGDTVTADFVGPEGAGIRAFLIDPAGCHDVPDGQRLACLGELPDRLATQERGRR